MLYAKLTFISDTTPITTSFAQTRALFNPRPPRARKFHRMSLHFTIGEPSLLSALPRIFRINFLKTPLYDNLQHPSSRTLPLYTLYRSLVPANRITAVATLPQIGRHYARVCVCAFLQAEFKFSAAYALSLSSWNEIAEMLNLVRARAQTSKDEEYNRHILRAKGTMSVTPRVFVISHVSDVGVYRFSS